jgi:hypothetical protein
MGSAIEAIKRYPGSRGDPRQLVRVLGNILADAGTDRDEFFAFTLE